eukprot:365126-Chlamydomonas_euryale.AAC.62
MPQGEAVQKMLLTRNAAECQLQAMNAALACKATLRRGHEAVLSMTADGLESDQQMRPHACCKDCSCCLAVQRMDACLSAVQTPQPWPAQCSVAQADPEGYPTHSYLRKIAARHGRSPPRTPWRPLAERPSWCAAQTGG